MDKNVLAVVTTVSDPSQNSLPAYQKSIHFFSRNKNNRIGGRASLLTPPEMQKHNWENFFLVLISKFWKRHTTRYWLSFFRNFIKYSQDFLSSLSSPPFNCIVDLAIFVTKKNFLNDKKLILIRVLMMAGTTLRDLLIQSNAMFLFIIFHWVLFVEKLRENHLKDVQSLFTTGRKEIQLKQI